MSSKLSLNFSIYISLWNLTLNWLMPLLISITRAKEEFSLCVFSSRMRLWKISQWRELCIYLRIAEQKRNRNTRHTWANLSFLFSILLSIYMFGLYSLAYIGQRRTIWVHALQRRQIYVNGFNLHSEKLRRETLANRNFYFMGHQIMFCLCW